MAPRLVGRAVVARDLVLDGRSETVSDEALVGLVLGEGNDALGRLVLREHPMPEGLWRVRAEDLCMHEGIGPAKAASLLACLELSRRAATNSGTCRPVVSTPEDVARLCGPQLRGSDREHFWALALNTKNQLIKTIEVSIGSLNASIVHPRELFKHAVRLSAASVVVVHNHPSGDPTPSGADIQLTRRLVKAGDVLGIEVLDHVVIGEGMTHASLRELGLM
ncbi:MAG: DNA repair protein [Actinobacteria bacterium]|nr:MAG: DNA repair protein [Actinomycetota bacterium]MDO8948975.1 DNA repair protein RadC [Actinomycetota bacterium]